jgi:hypothetical protein
MKKITLREIIIVLAFVVGIFIGNSMPTTMSVKAMPAGINCVTQVAPKPSKVTKGTATVTVSPSPTITTTATAITPVP